MPARFAPLLLAILLAACAQTVPATGERGFSLVSSAQEQRIGAEQHPEIIRAFGGVYEDTELAGYVAGIGGALVAASETPGEPFVFTVLDSDIVNAMALPGGYVYVTRGLIALANDEAELAGVLAHEIGHVTGRHTAQRVTRGAVAQLGAALLGIVVGSPQLADIARFGAQAYVQSFSREQEFEADSLGARYLRRAGYDPTAMTSFLESMRRHAAIEAQLAGRPADSVDQFNIMATHPRTAERVRRSIEAAGGGNGERRRDTLLARLDGLLYGEDPAEGVVRGRSFRHPAMRFEFTVPEGFTIANGETAVTAHGPGGAAIVFDGGPYTGGDLVAHLREWGRGGLQNVETFSVNGMPAATGRGRGQTEAGPADLRLVAIRFAPDRLYRFAFLSPPESTARLDPAFRATTFSLRPLSEAEAQAIRPTRLRVVEVGPGDTAESLAGRMPFERLQAERFRTLNGLAPGEQPQLGRRVKVVVEE